MFTVTIQNNQYSVEKTDKAITVNNQPINWDLKWISDKKIHLINSNQSMEAELISLDHVSKTLTIKLNTKIVTLDVKDRFDILLEKMGIDVSASTAITEIKAPMPGLILDLKVKLGDEVKKGDTVVVLEAMKMENIIKSPGDGIVKAIKVSLNESVEKNQVLIQF